MRDGIDSGQRDARQTGESSAARVRTHLEVATHRLRDGSVELRVEEDGKVNHEGQAAAAQQRHLEVRLVQVLKARHRGRLAAEVQPRCQAGHAEHRVGPHEPEGAQRQLAVSC